MKQEQFEQVIENQIQQIRNVLLVKQKEYATEDRLHNFRVVANLRGCTMAQALGGMLSKHTVSIYDMIESQEEYTIEKWDEKIIDHINYLLLLKAIVVEDESMKTEGVKKQDESVNLHDSFGIPIWEYHDPNSIHLTLDDIKMALEMKKLISEVTKEAVNGISSRER